MRTRNDMGKQSNVSLIRKLRQVYIFLRNPVHRVAWTIFRVVPIQRNKIVFDNFNGVGYADNPKYIAEEFRKTGEDYELIWLISRKCKKHMCDNLPDGIKAVQIHTLSMIYHMVTAKVWINNVRLSFFAKKREGQYYIQTWHGSYGGKKSEKDVEDRLELAYVKLAKMDSKLADIFLSNSHLMTEHYHRTYWYEGEVLECGFPRNDILVNNTETKRKEILEKLNIDQDEKIVLYAPTFRDDHNCDVLNLDMNRLRDALENRFPAPWKILRRLHPNLIHQEKEKITIPNVLDVTSYPDMQELLLIADVLITDYSSSYLDFILMKKPVFFYMPDYSTYVKDRDFHFDLTKIFVPCSYSNEELVNSIIQFDNETYQKELNDFKQWYHFVEDGTAGKAVAYWIKQKISNSHSIEPLEGK